MIVLTAPDVQLLASDEFDSVNAVETRRLAHRRMSIEVPVASPLMSLKAIESEVSTGRLSVVAFRMLTSETPEAFASPFAAPILFQSFTVESLKEYSLVNEPGADALPILFTLPASVALPA